MIDDDDSNNDSSQAQIIQTWGWQVTATTCFND